MTVSFGASETGSLVHGSASGQTFTVTKPAGLQEGDLLIALTGAQAETSTPSAPTSTGFSGVLSRSNASRTSMSVIAKIADADDESATDFTFDTGFDADGAESTHMAALFYVTTDASFTDITNITDTDDDDGGFVTSPTYSGGVSVVGSNALLVMGAVNGNGGSGAETVSSFSVTNNDPTWTEQEDFTETSGTSTDTGLAFGTATYANAGDTGDYTITFDGQAKNMGCLLTVQETSSVTVNAGVLTATSSLESTTESGNANVYQGFVDDSIVARFTLDENAANTNVADFTNTQPTATASQNTTNLSTTGQIGTAFDFNGSSDNVTVPHDSSQLLTTGFSFSVWVNAETLDGIILDKSANGGGAGFSWKIGSTSYTFTVGSAAIGFGVGEPATGEWQHLVVTVEDDGTFKGYKNGELLFENAGTVDPDDITTTNDLTIGSENDDTDFFDGKIDDVRMYSRVLTEDEVSKIYDKERLKATATLQSSTQSTTSSPWTNQSRSTGTWTNQSK